MCSESKVRLSLKRGNVPFGSGHIHGLVTSSIEAVRCACTQDRGALRTVKELVGNHPSKKRRGQTLLDKRMAFRQEIHDGQEVDQRRDLRRSYIAHRLLENVSATAILV